MNKKGVLGSLFSLFFATVVVFIILMLFVFLSGAVKLFSQGVKGEINESEVELGINDLDYYMRDYKESLVEKFYNFSLEVKENEDG